MKRLVLFAFFLLSIFEGLCAQSKFHIDVDYHYNLGISGAPDKPCGALCRC